MTALRFGLSRGGLEVRQFFRGRDSMVFSFLFPVMMLVVFAALFRGEVAPGVSFTRYFAAGMIATGLLGVGFQTLAIQIPIERDRDVLKRLMITPLPRSAYFIGKIVMVYTVGVGQILVLLITAVTLFDVPLPAGPAQWWTLIWVSGLGTAACTLCGVAFSSIPRDGRRAPALVTPVSLVLQFSSGVFLVYSEIPPWIQGFAAAFPLKWMAQGMRSAFLPESFESFEVGGSWALGRVLLVLTGWIVLGMLLCVLTFRWTARDDR